MKWFFLMFCLLTLPLAAKQPTPTPTTAKTPAAPKQNLTKEQRQMLEERKAVLTAYNRYEQTLMRTKGLGPVAPFLTSDTMKFMNSLKPSQVEDILNAQKTALAMMYDFAVSKFQVVEYRKEGANRVNIKIEATGRDGGKAGHKKVMMLENGVWKVDGSQNFREVLNAVETRRMMEKQNGGQPPTRPR